MPSNSNKSHADGKNNMAKIDEAVRAMEGSVDAWAMKNSFIATAMQNSEFTKEMKDFIATNTESQKNISRYTEELAKHTEKIVLFLKITAWATVALAFVNLFIFLFGDNIIGVMQSFVLMVFD